MNRSTTLDTAKNLVTGDRQDDYGDARESFDRIAALWTYTLNHRVTAEQVALCMAQLKIARAISNPGKADSWIDLAGYAALGAEIANAE